jgi:hypothetical protein
MGRPFIFVGAVLFLASGSTAAQGMPISADGTDPKTWAPGLDAVKAASAYNPTAFIPASG